MAGQEASTRANNYVSPCPRLCHLVEGVSKKSFMCKVNCDTLRFSGTQWDNVDPATDQMLRHASVSAGIDTCHEVGLPWTGKSLVSSETEPKPSKLTPGVRHFGYAVSVLCMAVGRGW